MEASKPESLLLLDFAVEWREAMNKAGHLMQQQQTLPAAVDLLPQLQVLQPSITGKKKDTFKLVQILIIKIRSCWWCAWRAVFPSFFF
jgi:hypothetical protein